ncbi:MAG: hypothetical protein II001_01950 [Bacteroidales bacterium]|nr:hypothetical protein [Bacteroidales bacterium]
MKKITLLMATLFMVSMMITGCDRDNPTPTPTPTPTPDPTPNTYTVVYRVDNQVGSLTLSPCFKMNVTYTDASGQQITEDGVTLPWSKSVDVNIPFHAEMSGTLTYNEADLPETVVYGLVRGIGLYTNGSGDIEIVGSMHTASKENFLRLITEHPDRLQFTMEKDF